MPWTIQCIRWSTIDRSNLIVQCTHNHVICTCTVLFSCTCRSTDSELKLWSTETGECIKTFRGHINEKNFVGLTVDDEFIACGKK